MVSGSFCCVLWFLELCGCVSWRINLPITLINTVRYCYVHKHNYRYIHIISIFFISLTIRTIRVYTFTTQLNCRCILSTVCICICTNVRYLWCLSHPPHTSGRAIAIGPRCLSVCLTMTWQLLFCFVKIFFLWCTKSVEYNFAFKNISYALLGAQLSWLPASEGAVYQHALWDTRT